jgi:hypothetical protein
MQTTSQTDQPRTKLAAQPGAIVGLAGAAALLLTLVPWLWPLNYPFRLLITIVHELSHGLAALATGGSFLRFVVFSNGEGAAYTAGGWRALVIPAGYLGAALFGAALILLGRGHRWSRVVLGVIGATTLLLSLRYGIPSVLSAQWAGGLIATLSGALLGAGFLLAAHRASPAWALFLTNLVAIAAGLTAFADLFALVGISRFAQGVAGGPATDARAMAELTFIPAIAWAVLWALVAAALIGGAAWRAWLRPRAGTIMRFRSPQSSQRLQR